MSELNNLDQHIYLTNWGKYPVIKTSEITFRTESDARKAVNRIPSIIPRGLGRCYGDSSLNVAAVFSSRRFAHMIDFDPTSGVLVCETGVSLAEILEAFAPRGWFPPVTPGTKFITIGGAIASNVHGKNHHLSGCFSRHVLWFDLLVAAGQVIHCSPTENVELFYATCGGHGLTGLILRAALRLIPIESVFIRQETVRANNLQEIMDCFETSTQWTYTVAWIDCLQKKDDLGRSIMIRGEHAKPADLDNKSARTALSSPKKFKMTVPFDLPACLLNPWSVKAFNSLYYYRTPAEVASRLVTYDAFFYPLDAIHHWNRLYGRRGFTQYQFVLPKAASADGLRRILSRIAESGRGSFLAVLKLFGPQETSGVNISFPIEGYTLALDFPLSLDLFPLLNELDAMVLDYGGRLYLSKDVRMSRAAFNRGYGRNADAFRQIKALWDPSNRFRSIQSERIGLGD